MHANFILRIKSHLNLIQTVTSRKNAQTNIVSIFQASYILRLITTVKTGSSQDVEAKAKDKARTFCPRAVVEVEDSHRGPHP